MRLESKSAFECSEDDMEKKSRWILATIFSVHAAIYGFFFYHFFRSDLVQFPSKGASDWVIEYRQVWSAILLAEVPLACIASCFFLHRAIGRTVMLVITLSAKMVGFALVLNWQAMLLGVLPVFIAWFWLSISIPNVIAYCAIFFVMRRNLGRIERRCFWNTGRWSMTIQKIMVLTAVVGVGFAVLKYSGLGMARDNHVLIRTAAMTALSAVYFSLTSACAFMPANPLVALSLTVLIGGLSPQVPLSTRWFRDLPYAKFALGHATHWHCLQYADARLILAHHPNPAPLGRLSLCHGE